MSPAFALRKARNSFFMPPLSKTGPAEMSAQLLLLGEKLDNAISRLDALLETVDAKLLDHEGRLRKLETETIPEMRRVESDLSARLAMWQILQTTFTTVVGAIASVIGRSP